MTASGLGHHYQLLHRVFKAHMVWTLLPSQVHLLPLVPSPSKLQPSGDAPRSFSYLSFGAWTVSSSSSFGQFLAHLDLTFSKMPSQVLS